MSCCVVAGSRYVVDAELRSRRIVDVVQYSSVEFIKTFWSVADTGMYSCTHMHVFVVLGKYIMMGFCYLLLCSLHGGLFTCYIP